MSERSIVRLLAAGALGGLLGTGTPAHGQNPAQPAAQKVSLQGPVMPWPTPIAARTRPADGQDELFITVLGDVVTPLADATFDPAADRLTRGNGEVVENYYREVLGIAHYAPIDKSVFLIPPSGWCSSFHHHEVTPVEIVRSARWLAENLRIYGARYVQIGDGWQGKGRGLGDNRDWTAVNERFGDMAGLAEEVRQFDLLPGLWIAPHGQSSGAVARESDVFLLRPEGASASSTWEGEFLLDPTSPGANEYLAGLFTRLRGWGYTYFKIDGQPTVIDEYRAKTEFMRRPPEGVSAEAWADEQYRATLGTIRKTIGNDAYLLGSWGTPLTGVGILHGGRTGGDAGPDWEGFLAAADAAQDWNFLHNIAWFGDPGALLVRPPLPEGVARSWATILGLTGQSLMAGDRLTDLPESRVELLRRVFPAVDIRPLDLFKPAGTRKAVWDLKVAHLGRSFDVVGVFNFDAEHAENRLVSWSTLGLDPARGHHVYDFWRGEYLGCFGNGVFVDVPARDVRVLTIVPAEELPQLISTSRHITQGWPDLLSLERLGDPRAPVLRGRSRIIANDPYTLTFAVPRGAAFSINGASVIGERGAPGRQPAPVGVRVTNHTGWGTVVLTTAQSQEVNWQVDFDGDVPFAFPVSDPPAPAVRPVGPTGAEVTWAVGDRGAPAYEVVLDGRPVGAAAGTRAVLRNLEPGAAHTVAVRALWWDGTASEGKNGVSFTVGSGEADRAGP